MSKSWKGLLWLIFILMNQTIFAQDYLHRENLIGEEQSIYYTIYQAPDQEIKGTILILHGMQEHSGRYEKIANFLAHQGYAVLTYDHLGHGRTAKTEEEHGYFLKNKGVEQLVTDTYLMTEKLHKEYPNVPHFILGHSMGSFITRAFLQEHSHLFNAAIIVGSGGKVPGIAFAKAYLAVKNTFAPHRRSKFVNNIFSNMGNKAFKGEKNELGTSWLSLSKKNQKAFLADSLNGIPFTNNGFYTLVKVNQKATKKHWAKSINKNFPMLFVSGAEDPIGDFGKGIQQSTRDLKEQGFKHIDQQLYPQMRHEILNEDIQEEVFQDIVNWMERWLEK